MYYVLRPPVSMLCSASLNLQTTRLTKRLDVSNSMRLLLCNRWHCAVCLLMSHVVHKFILGCIVRENKVGYHSVLWGTAWLRACCMHSDVSLCVTTCASSWSVCLTCGGPGLVTAVDSQAAYIQPFLKRQSTMANQAPSFLQRTARPSTCK